MITFYEKFCYLLREVVLRSRWLISARDSDRDCGFSASISTISRRISVLDIMGRECCNPAVIA